MQAPAAANKNRLGRTHLGVPHIGFQPITPKKPTCSDNIATPSVEPGEADIMRKQLVMYSIALHHHSKDAKVDAERVWRHLLLLHGAHGKP